MAQCTSRIPPDHIRPVRELAAPTTTSGQLLGRWLVTTGVITVGFVLAFLDRVMRDEVLPLWVIVLLISSWILVVGLAFASYRVAIRGPETDRDK